MYGGQVRVVDLYFWLERRRQRQREDVAERERELLLREGASFKPALAHGRVPSWHSFSPLSGSGEEEQGGGRVEAHGPPQRSQLEPDVPHL